MTARTLATAAAAGAAHTPAWAHEILTFWFRELQPVDWFRPADGPALDAKITTRFLPLYRELAAETPAAALSDRDTALATVIALDQFPRNMFRRKAEAFGSDHAALAVSKNAVAKGLDKDLPLDRKMFLYMPYMHSENLEDQHTALELFTAIGDEKGIDFCKQHRDIIAEFGRFPYRNDCLGRESTAEELAFTAKHGGFGQ